MKYTYRRDEFDNAKKRILDILKRNKSKGIDNVKAYVLGGQPGAGKSSAQKSIEKRENNDIIKVDLDTYRVYHPRNNLIEKNETFMDAVDITTPFAMDLRKEILEELSNDKYNLLVELTVRSVETPAEVSGLLKNNGYQTELYVVAVKPEISFLSTLLRFEEMKKDGYPRLTEKSYHDEVVANIANNLSKLYENKVFDKITLVNRESVVLYDQSKTPEIDPDKVLKNEFDRPFTEKEKTFFKEVYQYVANLIDQSKNTPLETPQVNVDNLNEVKNKFEKKVEKDEKSIPLKEDEKSTPSKEKRESILGKLNRNKSAINETKKNPVAKGKDIEL